MTRRCFRPSWLLAIVGLTSANQVHAGWPEQLNKLPAIPNAVALIQVERLRQAADQLGDQAAEAKKVSNDIQAELTSSIRQIALVASIDLNNLEPNWELALCDMARIPSNDDLARIEQGYVDQIGEKTFIWSPRNTYFLPLPNSMLAVFQPTNRQLVGRWVQGWTDRANPLPDYLQQALTIASDDVPIVMALDMSGAISAVPARAKLGQFPPIQQSGVNVDDLADLLTHIQGVTFGVLVKDGLIGRVRVDFDRPADLLAGPGKAIFLEILSRAHASIADLAQWEPKVSGNSFSMSGPMSATGVRQLLSMLRSPATVGSMSDQANMYPPPSPGQDQGTPAQPPPNLQAQASKKYFLSVTRIVDQDRDLHAQSMGERAMWDDKFARKIDALPILNVDPDLINYGANVSSLLRGAGLTIRNTNLQAGVQKIGNQTTTVGGAVANPYSGTTGFVNLYSPTHINEKITQQARQTGMSAHLKNMSQIDQMTADVRRDMTMRYQIEF